MSSKTLWPVEQGKLEEMIYGFWNYKRIFFFLVQDPVSVSCNVLNATVIVTFDFRLGIPNHTNK